jgi:hypothetical protein
MDMGSLQLARAQAIVMRNVGRVTDMHMVDGQVQGKGIKRKKVLWSVFSL